MRWFASILFAALCIAAAAPTAAHATTLTPPLPAAKSDEAAARSALQATTLAPDDTPQRDTGPEPPRSEPPAVRPTEIAPPKAAPQASPPARAAPAPKSLKTAPAKASKPKRPPRPATTLQAHIDLTKQQMTVRSGGTTLHTWKISSGARGYDTPTGRFRPKWVARRWHSRKYDMAPMPYSVFFNGGIATHGTTSVRRLGRPASHGCIRLKTANARKFYKLVRKHGLKRTRIVVTGKAKHPPPQLVTKQRPARRSTRNRRRSSRRTYVYRPNRGWFREQHYRGYRGYSYFAYPHGRY